jgi:hypothetical protein
MTTLLAQADFGSLRADFIKSLVVAFIALGVFISFVVVAVVAWLQYRLDKKSKRAEAERHKESQPREITPQPLNVQIESKKWTQSVARKAHEDLERRVEQHEEEIAQLRADHHELSTDIRKQLSDMPGKIVADMLNAKQLFKSND